jgi:hypothetical protein
MSVTSTNIRKLRAFAKQCGYTHFEVAERGFLRFYSVDECEVCGDQVGGVNGVKVVATQHEALSAGLIQMSAPDEGGYSELHECSTCSACCYNENPRGRYRKDGQFTTLPDGTPFQP